MTTDHEVLSGRMLGEFILLDRIGEGGSGAVYRARQAGLSRPAVVKVLHARAPAADSSVQRLVREARLACQVEHLYAAHVYAFGVEDDGLLWIAMELIDGISLDDWLAAHGPMPLEVFVPFFERVAQVVQAAHEQDIVHRDIKPANIMVIEQAGELLPKLLDFGLAKLVDDVTGRERPGAARTSSRPGDSLTASDCVLGSASYMAPEAWTEPAAVGPAADIYALGVIAFEALTGRRPYRGETFHALGVLHCEGAIPPGPAPLRRALAKRPEDRHDSALALAAALRLESTRERRRARLQRIYLAAALIAVAITGAVIQGRAMHLTRMAQQRVVAAEHEAHATVLTAEVEQGRAALLHDDLAGARRHLASSGDHSRATEFMLDRATQPLRSELARFKATRGRMWSSSWSPDGALIATTDDAGARIWDAQTYQSLEPLPHDDVVYAAVWTPAGRLVTACGDGSVRIWDPARADLLRELRLVGRRPRWYAVAVAGTRIAAVDAKGGIAAVWDAGTGVVLAELQLGGAGWPAVAFSTDGRWLAATGGGSVQVMDITTLRIAVATGEQARAIAWDPTGARLLVGSATGSAAIWSALGRGPPTPTARLGEAVTAVAFSPDGASEALGGEDGTEQIVDTASGRIFSQGNYLHAKIASLAFSVDGRQVVAAAVSGELAIGDVVTGLPVEVLEGPAQQLRDATFGPTGRRVLAASWDGTTRIWDARSPYRQWSAARQSSGFGLFGGVEPDGRYLAIACPGCSTRVWDTAQDRLLAELPEVERSERVPYPVVSARGDRAAIARGTTAEIYELPGSRLLRTIRHGTAVTALAFDGQELVSGATSGAVLVTRGDGSTALELGGDAPIDALAVLPGDRIASGDARGRVRIVPAGPEIDVGIRARMLRPSPDGRRLLVVAYYSERAEPMVLVDLDCGTVVRLDGPAAYTARWVDGGILSAHADGAARFWSPDGALRRTYIGGARFLADADLSPDGSMVIGGGGDGLLRFWDTETTKPLWVVSAHRPYVMGVHFEGGDIVTRGIGGEVARWHIPAANDAKSALSLPNP